MNVISVETKRGRKYVVGDNCTKITDCILYFDVYTGNKIIRLYDVIEAELDLTNPAGHGTMVAEGT